MSKPRCHVFCEERGETLCRTGELEIVKRAVNALSTAKSDLIAGEYADAERQARAALEAVRAAAAVGNGRSS